MYRNILDSALMKTYILIINVLEVKNRMHNEEGTEYLYINYNS